MARSHRRSTIVEPSTPIAEREDDSGLRHVILIVISIPRIQLFFSAYEKATRAKAKNAPDTYVFSLSIG